MNSNNQNFAQIERDEFKAELKSGEVILIDLRQKEEQEKYGTLSDDQLHIVYGSNHFQEELLSLKRDKKYLLYCWHGVRSENTRKFMQENGFSWVKDLQGGIDKWKN